MSAAWPYGERCLKQMSFFCDVIIRNQHLLWLPELSFFKDFIEAMGGFVTVPPKKLRTPPKTPESEPESDLDISSEGCVESDELSPDQKMGNPDKEVTDEDREKAIEKRTEALQLLAEDKPEKALEVFTEAIEIDPTSALLFAKRGLAYLKVLRPEACMKDCTRALELNPHCAQAYKYRGRALRLVGEWPFAANDLRKSLALDYFDEEAREWLEEIAPKAKRVQEHVIKQARKEIRRRSNKNHENLIKARDEYDKARKAGQTSKEDAIAHAKAAKEFDEFFRDPDYLHFMTNPEVAAAIRDMSGCPGKIYKYAKSPNVMAFLNLMCKRFMLSGIPRETLLDFYKWGAFKSVPEIDPEEADLPPQLELPDGSNLG